MFDCKNASVLEVVFLHFPEVFEWGLERLENQIIEVSNDAQCNEVLDDGNRRHREGTHEAAHDLGCQQLGGLHQPSKVAYVPLAEPVGMVQTVLHLFDGLPELVHQPHVQHERAHEPRYNH